MGGPRRNPRETEQGIGCRRSRHDVAASGQYRPKFPSPYLQKEIFVLNLEDGFFGCQVNESTEVLQLFELSQLCDGVPQCFQGSDELARDLKCTDKNHCHPKVPRCTNGACLDNLCYCNDGYGGKGCEMPVKPISIRLRQTSATPRPLRLVYINLQLDVVYTAEGGLSGAVALLSVNGGGHIPRCVVPDLEADITFVSMARPVVTRGLAEARSSSSSCLCATPSSLPNDAWHLRKLRSRKNSTCHASCVRRECAFALRSTAVKKTQLGPWCGATPTLFHVTWECAEHDEEHDTPGTREEWETLLSSPALVDQLRLIHGAERMARASGALE
ncbi:hypothetical protein HPB51_013384 [Rhipicephalus microplus]|uniref:EGF-like domain-containing protein n=1 Tax=Rhipicephalus microplus TaxID=6941 RepID=A0A9J6F4F3_RHIMP|nr:hypothetical protein HPB51_013384 [Rhipicephalus microplus]